MRFAVQRFIGEYGIKSAVLCVYGGVVYLHYVGNFLGIFPTELYAPRHIAHLLPYIVTFYVYKVYVFTSDCILLLRLFEQPFKIFKFGAAQRFTQKAELVTKYKEAEQYHCNVEKTLRKGIVKHAVDAYEQTQYHARRNGEYEFSVVEVRYLLFVELTEEQKIESGIDNGKNAKTAKQVVQRRCIYAGRRHKQVAKSMSEMLRRLGGGRYKEYAPPRLLKTEL